MNVINCFLFSGIDDLQMQKIEQIIGKPIVSEKGSELYRNGQMGILASGCAGIKRQDINGNSVTVRNLSSGELFGAASMFGEWQDGLSSIIANEKCIVCYISENELKEIFSQIPEVALNYISYLTDRIRFLNRRIDTFSADSVEQKVYEYLMSLADCDGKIELTFGMSELARRLKIGRTSLYRSFDFLEKTGQLKRDKNIFYISQSL